jgi:hypothetical protein
MELQTQVAAAAVALPILRKQILVMVVQAVLVLLSSAMQTHLLRQLLQQVLPQSQLLAVTVSMFGLAPEQLHSNHGPIPITNER